jgi:hypothetical protein
MPHPFGREAIPGLKKFSADPGVGHRTDERRFPAVGLRVLNAKDKDFGNHVPDPSGFKVQDSQDRHPPDFLHGMAGEAPDTDPSSESAEIDDQTAGRLGRRRLRPDVDDLTEPDVEPVKRFFPGHHPLDLAIHLTTLHAFRTHGNGLGNPATRSVPDKPGIHADCQSFFQTCMARKSLLVAPGDDTALSRTLARVRRVPKAFDSRGFTET